MVPPFTWLVRGVLAGGPHPRTMGGLASVIGVLRAEGIGSILTVYDRPLEREEVSRHGLRYLWLPTRDWAPPDLRAACAFIEESRAGGSATLVHCLAGLGRTGTVLAAWLLRSGACHTADEARRRVRTDYDPLAIESEEQFDALVRFAGGCS